MTLPPLPRPAILLTVDLPMVSGAKVKKQPFYTEDQMRDYATAAVLAERARCIAIVEKWRDAYPSEDGTRDALDDLRSAV